ncbi:hypothetical protein GQ42DRAFT_156040 [Ramicandelaber brevisporus]|nr:hypothetical protein GQ42DRAFT_156040 [Ramicandelaber brevisporus]
MNISNSGSPRSSVLFLSAEEIAPSFIAASAANSRAGSRNVSRRPSFSMAAAFSAPTASRAASGAATPRKSTAAASSEHKKITPKSLTAAFNKSFNMPFITTGGLL